MDQAVAAYIANIPGPFRPMFDRISALIFEVCPGAELVLTYAMPTYRTGRRLFVAVWAHGVSLYGWRHEGGFSLRHPELISGKATIRLTTGAAAAIPDEEFRDLIRGVLVG
ncbi:MAG: hypothetical protein ACHP7K_10515 [Actinomycetales bacterium]